ncbi:MAG: DUF1345 domain-containing protein [Alcaligenaceae bacterium]|jgi:uncharacterized membrane protein
MSEHSHPKPLVVLYKMLRSRPILLASGLAGLVVAVILPLLTTAGFWMRLIVGWNAGSLLYLGLLLRLMTRANPEMIRARALHQNDGKLVILILVVLSAIVCLGSIIQLLAISKDLQGLDRVWHIALAGLTVLSSWTFTQFMFATHYAHEYYSALALHREPGLQFPGATTPDYLDFVYFACVIGTSGQTADVSISSQPMRRVSLIHCVFAFFFNTSLIALTINIAASLI